MPTTFQIAIASGAAIGGLIVETQGLEGVFSRLLLRFAESRSLASSVGAPLGRSHGCLSCLRFLVRQERPGNMGGYPSYAKPLSFPR